MKLSQCVSHCYVACLLRNTPHLKYPPPQNMANFHLKTDRVALAHWNTKIVRIQTGTNEKSGPWWISDVCQEHKKRGWSCRHKPDKFKRNVETMLDYIAQSINISEEQ